ncbi:MAG: PDZ domain-containing protein [Nitriliruptoraceae bacterium]
MSPTENGHPRRRRFSRIAFFSATAALVAWAAFLVPLPVIEYVPASPTSIPPLIEIDGVETTELDGDVALLTVFLRQQPTVPALAALIDPARDLIPYEEVYPREVDREEIRRLERARFARQFDIAAAVGASAAGVETELVTEVVVVQVLPGSPASGRLTPGEVVVAVDGEPLGSAEELQAISREGELGDVLTLTVRRDGERREVDVELAAFGGVDEPRIGVGIQTAVDEVRLPFDVRLAEDTRIGGPSAGLMVGVTIYDLLSEENLLAGRYVTGTGTLDADGRVGTVSGVPEKVRAAHAAGAEVMLVPRPHLDEARADAPEGLEIIGVSSLEEALEALRPSAD